MDTHIGSAIYVHADVSAIKIGTANGRGNHGDPYTSSGEKLLDCPGKLTNPIAVCGCLVDLVVRTLRSSAWHRGVCVVDRPPRREAC
jgi:hypothetical protein